MGSIPTTLRIGIMPMGVKGQNALELGNWPGTLFTLLLSGEAYRWPIAEAIMRKHAQAGDAEGAKLHLPAWVPADFVDLSDWETEAAEWGPAPGGLSAPWSYRKAKHVKAVTCMVLDLDDGFDRAKADALCRQWVHFGHTSWRHTPDAPKARLVFPLSQPVPVAEWGEVWAAGARWAAHHGLTTDPACKDPCRAYFLPVRPPGREAFFEAWCGSGQEGCLEASWLLKHYPAPAPPPAALRPPVALPVRPYSPAASASPEEVAERRARAYLEKVIEGLSTTGKGGRNKAAFVAGSRLGARSSVLPPGDVDHYHHAIVAAAVASGLSDTEARTAVANGIEAGLTQPLETA